MKTEKDRVSGDRERERRMKEMGNMEEEIERARMSYRGRGRARGIE